MRILKRMPTTKYFKDLGHRIFRIAIMEISIKVRKLWDKRSIQGNHVEETFHTILIANRKNLLICILHRNRLKRRILCVDQELKHLQCTVLCNTITLKINFLLVRTVSKGAYFLLIKALTQTLWTMVKTWQSYHLQGSVEINILGSFSLLPKLCSHTTLKDLWVVSLQLEEHKTSLVFNLQRLVTKAIITIHLMTMRYLSYIIWLLDNWVNLRAGITL